ncbi:MAG: serine hydrolase domain-containing protein, partial [Rhodovarius sp.]|nr:serine hydrolase domain-containing protein [Rhodovarius sp.]
MDMAKLERMAAIIQRHIEEGRQPGAAVAVARRGELLFHRVFGQAAAGRPATPDTLWLLYSNTKVITACGLWILAEEGRLRFEDPIALHIPRFARHGKGAITILQLLTHQAGFPDAVMPETAWGDPAAIEEVVCDFTLQWTPGSRVHYHPASAHWVAAALIHAITGQDHRDFLRERIARPLGLERELYVGLPASEHHRAADMHDPTPAGPVPRLPECSPAHRMAGVPGGGGYATARAVALFYQALLGYGPRLISRRMLAYVTRNFTGDRVDEAMGVPMHRGLGPALRGHTAGARGLGALAHPAVFGHGGVGSSQAWADPDSGVSFVFVANARQPDEAWHLARLDLLSNLV